MLRKTLETIFGLDLRSLAVFRIGVAVVLLGDLFIRWTDLGLFYTDQGVLPRVSLLTKSPPHTWFVSLHLWNGTIVFQNILFLIAVLAAFGLLVGYRTRWMTCLCWFLTSSLHARNFLVLQGGDDYLRMSLFWGMFLPLGARFSIDAMRNSSRQKLPGSVFSWGSFALVMQTVLLYASTATFKSRGTAWWDGSALYYALNLDCFAKEPAFFLLLFPGLLEVLTRGVFALEFFGSFLLLSPFWNGPLRTLGVFAFIGLHLGILLTMAIGPFQWISMVAVTAFLPTWFWERTALLFGERWASFKKRMASLQKDMQGLLSRLPRRPLTIQPSMWSAPFILFSLGCVVWWDLSALKPDKVPLPKVISNICYLVNLKQGWAMFSPNVTRSSGWFVVPGKLANGSIVDLNRGGRPLSWAPPPLVSAYFGNERRRKFLMNMRSSNIRAFRVDYSLSLCREWNKTHSADQQLQSLEVIFMERVIPPDYQISGHEPKVLWHAYCSPDMRSFGPPLPRLGPRPAANQSALPINNPSKGLR